MKRELIKITNLTKKYGSIVALKDVSITINKGDVIGILGPNGAGKTTLISIIATLRHPTSGKVTLNSQDVFENKQQIKKTLGLVFQETSLDKKLTVGENLTLHAILFGIPKNQIAIVIESTIKEFELGKIKDRIVETLSGGERQRVELAKCFMHHPDIFIFDEPTVGLDPKIRRDIWGIIKKISNAKKTIIITSHYLDEIEQLCEKIVIINDGSIILADTISNISQKADRIIRIQLNEKTSKESLGRILNTEVEKLQDYYVFPLDEKRKLNSILEKLGKNGFTLKNIETSNESLERIYLKTISSDKE